MVLAFDSSVTGTRYWELLICTLLHRDATYCDHYDLPKRNLLEWPIGTPLLFDPTRRFGFGVNLDDPWIYTGQLLPKSIIIPHLLSIGREEDSATDEHAVNHRLSRSTEATLNLVENLTQAGIDFVRCWFPWNYFEPVPVPEDGLDSLLCQSYQRWPFDNFVQVLSDNAIDVIPVLACGYQRMLPKGLTPDMQQEEYIHRASIHAQLLVRHYKDKINCWQIENEPNWWGMHSAAGWRTGSLWQGANEFGDRLLGSLNNAVHSEDSSALTIVNLEADARKLDAGHYAKYCDVLGLDFYPNYKRSSPINTSKIKIADQIATSVGKPVLLVETGYPTGPFLLGYTFSNQAKYVRSAMLEAYGLDRVNGLGVWRYIDSSWKSFPYQENHFGLIDANGTPKLGWNSLTKTISDLKN